MSQMADRKLGFLNAMKTAGLKINPWSVLEVPYQDSREKSMQALRQFLQSHPKIDALYFATNYLGVLGIEVLKELKINIGKDMAVVCFDDNDLFRLLEPSITVSAQPIHEIATHSIELLLKLLKKEQKIQELVGTVIEPTIIVRHSSPLRK